MIDPILQEAISAYVKDALDQIEAINDLRWFIHTLSPLKAQPIDFVRWVAHDCVKPNDYNPNSVAQIEMKLLATSIEHDGFTQPVVTVRNGDTFEIVDGFHRYFVAKEDKTIWSQIEGHLPITVIDKPINDRMASTVRHNRARGKHSITGMSSMVFSMLDNGWSDAEICNELGMEAEELLRLKHITGFSKLFADAEYNRSWVTRRQIRIKKAYQEKEK